MTIYKIRSSSDPGKHYYYMPIGQQMPIPEFAKLYLENPRDFVRAPELMDREAYEAGSTLDGFRRTLQARGSYVELSDHNAKKLIEQFHLSEEEVILDSYVPRYLERR